ncbi:hypothetical protein CsSME_00033301 [Camellia sinensis var. sinensis]
MFIYLFIYFKCFNVIACRLSILWKYLINAKFQKGKCAFGGGSLAGGFTVSACGTSLILARSPWAVLPWPKRTKFLECFTEVPFMRCFVCRFLLLNLYVLLGLSNPHRLKIRESFHCAMLHIFHPSYSLAMFVYIYLKRELVFKVRIEP